VPIPAELIILKDESPVMILRASSFEEAIIIY